jgi:hypothetical protein
MGQRVLNALVQSDVGVAGCQHGADHHGVDPDLPGEVMRQAEHQVVERGLGCGVGEELERWRDPHHRPRVGDRGVFGGQQVRSAGGGHPHRRQAVELVGFQHVLGRNGQRVG